MSIPKIRAALEKHLLGLTPAMATAFENVAFTPVAGTPYQRLSLLTNKPDNSTMGQSGYFEIGIFQITICAPLGTGPAAAEARAQLIRAHFRRGTSLVESGVTVIITDTPSVSPSMVDADRFNIPISIAFQAQITTP